MAFRFKFETLLDVRKMQENMAQQAFSQSQRQLRALIAMKERVLARATSWRAELVTRMKSGLGSSEVKRYYDYLLHLDEGVARIDENIVKAEHQAEEKRQELLRAERAHKAMRRAQGDPSGQARGRREESGDAPSSTRSPSCVPEVRDESEDSARVTGHQLCFCRCIYLAIRPTPVEAEDTEPRAAEQARQQFQQPMVFNVSDQIEILRQKEESGSRPAKGWNSRNWKGRSRER